MGPRVTASGQTDRRAYREIQKTRVNMQSHRFNNIGKVGKLGPDIVTKYRAFFSNKLGPQKLKISEIQAHTCQL